MQLLYSLVPLAPLFAAIVVGLFGRSLGRAPSHWICILGVAISFLLSSYIAYDVYRGNVFNGAVYTWLKVGDIAFQIGFLIDQLTATMMVVVSFVSLMVHIYTVGYMADDEGYTRFFSYIALFTFSMLMLVMANNFLQLFFGWEAVGLVSYLLIGFWYKRPSAIHANLKAFLVNRVGDFGFLLGIGLVLAYFGTLDYAVVFKLAPRYFHETVNLIGDMQWSVLSVICILLFIGAMGKSAQVPLHVWLPDSMEGPTPISALIHAATMVTAGIFMVARMSPLFELSDTALSVVIIVGAITALFMALVAIVQNDIKRVVAYSTLSQLGYMTVALGASAYSIAIFHLMTHAFFKALLFLGAGSVIIAMHHEQDMRKMGGLKRYMPITYWTMLVGALSSAGIPGFAGFFSKDAIIEAARYADIPGARFAYFAVLICVFVTALYTFRMLFMTFHRQPRMDPETRDHLHESPPVVTVPLILLAIPSVAAGWLIGSMVFGNFFGDSIAILPHHSSVAHMREEFHGVGAMMLHAIVTAPFWLALAGIAVAAYCYLLRPGVPAKMKARAGALYDLLSNKYYFDEFNERVFGRGTRKLGELLSLYGDRTIIDGWLVNGSAKLIGFVSSIIRYIQSGYVYHYAFTMIIGVLALLTVWFTRF